MFGASRILGNILLEYRQILLNKLSNNVIQEFSKDMFDYLMKMEYAIFKNNSERVLSTFNRSLMGIERMNRFVIGNIMSNIIEFGIISGMLYFLCGRQYFINTIIIYALYLTATKLISIYKNKLIDEKQEWTLQTEAKLYNIIHNISTVKYFQREDYEGKAFAELVRETREKDQKIMKSLSILNVAQNIIISSGMIINLYMSIHDCFTGRLTAGDVVMLQAIFAQIMMPLNFMGMLMKEIDDTKVNLKYAVDMIENKDKMKNIILPEYQYKGGEIEFKDVHFTYNPNSRNVLDGLNLKFEKGTFNAIVGHSGSGKSTLFNLLYKLYEPSKGQIIVDGQDIYQVNNDSLRKVL